MIDYMKCIGDNFPTVIASCAGDNSNYADLKWEAGDPIPSKAVLDASLFQTMKADKLAELSYACQVVITSGFLSNALGSLHMYDSEEVDQLNLVGSTANVAPTPTLPDGSSCLYACREVVGGITQPKSYKLHSYSQLRQIMSDGVDYKLSLLVNFNTKRYYVETATTIVQINAINWSSIP
jgi:hypothetical protein